VVEKLAEKKKDIGWITDPKFHQSLTKATFILAFFSLHNLKQL
jgi:hypothetical protein